MTREDWHKFLQMVAPKLYPKGVPDEGIGPGWWPIVTYLSGRLESEGATGCATIKEKFGGLRFYLNSETDATTALIQEAEDQAEHTCEECGAPGRVGGKGWLKCACEEHRKC